jgi:hypothetical protein
MEKKVENNGLEPIGLSFSPSPVGAHEALIFENPATMQFAT